MKSFLNLLNGVAQFIIGVIFLFLMFQVSLGTFYAAIALAIVAYPLYRLLLVLPLGSTLVFAIQAWIAYAAGQPLLVTIGFFYVPFSLVVDIVNFASLFGRPNVEQYLQQGAKSRIQTVE